MKNLIFKEIKLSEFLNGTWYNLSIQLASQKLGTKSTERISGAVEVSEKIINLLLKRNTIMLAPGNSPRSSLFSVSLAGLVTPSFVGFWLFINQYHQ